MGKLGEEPEWTGGVQLPPRRSAAVLGAIALCVVGCRGEKLATVELRAAGSAEASFEHHGQPLLIWADTDAKWSGPKNSKPEIDYDVEVLQKGAAVGRVKCSTSERGTSSICGTHTNTMGSHDADCEIELACKLPALEPGKVVLRVTASLGSNVKSVKNMSLNVREQ